MTETKPGNRERIKELVTGIEQNIQDLFQSEKYFDYLRTMSRFHKYSYGNTVLIHMQRPDATRVAGFHKWKNQFGRHVKKGEKGITIIAPAPFKKKIEEMKLDPDTQVPLLDSEGNAIIEEKEVEIPLFRPVKVFDVSQTDGEPLPSLASNLIGDVHQYEAFMEALRRSSPVPITIKPIDWDVNGFFLPTDQTITIREGMSEMQTVCTSIHEITHAKLHNQEQTAVAADTRNQEPPKPKDKNTQEIEAESVAFVVCQYYGIDTSAKSLGYIAGWSRNRTLPELKGSLETISRTANGLITDIDRHFTAICKERGIDLAAAPERSAETPTAEQSEPHYVYKMEVNPRTTGEADRFFIQTYERTGQGTLKPEEMLFAGSYEICSRLWEHLQNGTLQHDDFFRVSAAGISRYAAKDSVELDAFIAPDNKIYLGRRDHYDNFGHYVNQDKSLIHISDNKKIFEFLSGSGYAVTQREILEQGHFTQEDYAEFAELQTGILAQFQETKPLLFGEESFCFPLPDITEPEQTVPVPEPVQSDTITALDEYPMPDTTLTIKDLEREGGYLDGDMLPLSKERATELLEDDFTVYAIIDSGGAEMVFGPDEMSEYPSDTMFIVPREEWEISPNFRQAVANRMDHQEEREKAFLEHSADCFAIYQLRHDDSTRYLRYEPLERARQAGDNPQRANYELAYTSTLPPEQDLSVLDMLWDKFNTNHPADYQHPSMSVSDIIAIKQGGVLSCHYCDRFGFQRLPDFIKPENYLKNAEIAAEDDYNMIDGIVNNGPKEPTVAELEAQVKAGQSISLTDLAGAIHRESGKKKSVLAQLKAGTPKQERKKQAPQKRMGKER